MNNQEIASHFDHLLHQDKPVQKGPDEWQYGYFEIKMQDGVWKVGYSNQVLYRSEHFELALKRAAIELFLFRLEDEMAGIRDTHNHEIATLSEVMEQ